MHLQIGCAQCDFTALFCEQSDPIFILCFHGLAPNVPDGNLFDFPLIRRNEALINALMLHAELVKEFSCSPRHHSLW